MLLSRFSAQSLGMSAAVSPDAGSLFSIGAAYPTDGQYGRLYAIEHSNAAAGAAQ